jgi:hypothetical protein
MPAPLAIPLVAVAAPAASAVALQALKVGAFIGSAVAAGVGAKVAIDKLTPASSPNQVATATDNFLKAEKDFEAARASSFGKIASADIGKEIAKNYPYVEWDDVSGRLAIASDSTLANGGDLIVNQVASNVNVQNGVINTLIPFENYGTDDIPLAVTRETPVNVALSDDGTLPLIVNREVIAGNAQSVAEAVIAGQKISDNDVGDEYPVAPASPDVVGSDIQGIAPTDAADIIFGDVARTQGQDLVDPGLQAELAREAARARAWTEDAATTSDSGSIARAGSLEQARSLERQDATAIAANDPGGTPVMPSSGSGLRSEAATDPTYNSSTSTKRVNTSGVINRSVEYPQEKPNPLHAYANYTFKISLYQVPKDVMNQITMGLISPGGEDSIIAQSELILSSGGSKSGDKGTYFKEDFFVDNLEIESIVGQSAQNRSTDAVSIKFDIIEPYNMTLLPRLVASTYAQTGRPDWGMAFYLMKIQFLGYDDNGQPVEIPKTTKYVPFNIAHIKFDITGRGTVYNVQGIPCAHFAQTLLDNTIPFHMEFSGGTLDELFNSSATFAASKNQAGGGRVSEAAQASAPKQSGPQTFTKGVAAALNSGEEYLVKTGSQTYPNKYSFEFDEDLKNAKVIDSQTYNILGLRYSNKKDPNEQNAAAPPPIDQKNNAFRVQAGTRITDLISSVLQVSSYITDQYSATPPQDKPLYSWKIIPFVKFGEYDPKTNMWSREITYSVIPYTIFGQDHPNFGQKAPPGATKRFKWLFTGQSKDVIDVKLSYESAFFNIVNGAEKAQLDDSAKSDRVDADPKKKSGAFPTRYRPFFGIPGMNHTGPRTLNQKTLAVEELFNKQFDSLYDNISLDISIVGDPDFIQQDNIMYGKGEKGKFIYDSAGLNYTNYAAYFWLDFKAPYNDYNERTGLFDVASSNTSFFSGLYQIISVKSKFVGGKFTQELQNNRVKIQSNTGNQEDERGNRGIKAETSKSTLIVQDDSTGVDEAISQRQVDKISQSSSDPNVTDQTVNNANSALNAATDQTQQLIDNNPGDPNVPTSPFG